MTSGPASAGSGAGLVEPSAPDHGGGLDAACAEYGGTRADWLDLSTGINPVPYPHADIPLSAWTDLPDRAAHDALVAAARAFWQVPDRLRILPTPGTSAAIAHLPLLAPSASRKPPVVHIRRRTYNEHAAAFRRAGWRVAHADPLAPGFADAGVIVHPDNPTGDLWPEPGADRPKLLVIDESFGECAPDTSLIDHAGGGTVLLKGLGKFWGLAGLRLGFVIGAPDRLAPMAAALGPWPVSGPALHLGARALRNAGWIAATRNRIGTDAARLDAVMTPHLKPDSPPRGTTLFRLYTVPDAKALQTRLARARIWSRAFPYDPQWIRLGLPGTKADWTRLETALAAIADPASAAASGPSAP